MHLELYLCNKPTRCTFFNLLRYSYSTGPRWLVSPEVGYCSLQAYCTSPTLEVPAYTARSPTSSTTRETFMGEKCPVNLPSNTEFHAIWRDLLHAANLRNGTPLRRKTWKIRLGSKPRTWGPEASMLPPRPQKPPIYYDITPLHDSGPFVAHHQEAKLKSGNGTCFTYKATVGGPYYHASTCFGPTCSPSSGG
jgi:hypothetical protein